MLVIFAALLFIPIAVSAQESPPRLRIGDLIETLRKNNPELNERRLMAKAASAKPRAVSQLDDPMLSVEWWQQPTDFSTVPIMFMLRQPLPWPGKLRARKQVAQKEAATSHDQIGETQRRLEIEVKRAFFDLALAEASLSVNERVRILLEGMVASAEVKYKVGRAPQAAMLKAQSELLTADNERLDLERARGEARVRLNVLLDRPQDTALPTTELRLSRFLVPDEQELVRMAIDRRPGVRLAQDAVAEAEAKLDVARREVNPELAVWAGYMVNFRGIDTFTTGVSTTLPIFSARRRSALVDAGQSEVLARKSALEAAKRRAEADVHNALLQMESAQRHERLHAEKLIPLAELTLQSAQAAYQTDRIDFLSVLDAARMLRDHHLNHERYLIEYERRLADLELAVGQDFTREATP